MGGHIAAEPAVIDQIWELVAAICRLPEGFPRGEPFPCLSSTDGVSGGNSSVFLYYFDVGPSQEETPGVKLYFPAWNYASDRQIADGLAGWMRKHGRGQFVDAYLGALGHIISHRRLNQVGAVGSFCAAQMMISIMVKGGKLQVTSYISPEGHHPGRSK
ncbi:aromatic prenyltransferase [Diaporthe helianthi]|uniref:Aromatic prenyltransferase n=1 Tax=Diaporthe helianthi TaxID=158607 RepID=A0A2P5HFX5_DIAHE|nr:aromatic prenyltransferase [Diaporthe helianthi]